MKNLVLVFLLMFVSTQVFSADGSSGCGPGWYVFKKNSLVSSSLRATTNGVLFPSTTIGMTIGSSNCSKHSIVKKEKESLKFASENYFEIAADASRGQGEFLNSFATTIGCRESGQQVFDKEMKKNFKKIYNSKKVDPERMLMETYILIFSSEELVKSCVLS